MDLSDAALLAAVPQPLTDDELANLIHSPTRDQLPMHNVT